MDYELIAKALFERYESLYDINVETAAYVVFHESDAYHELQLGKSGDDFFGALRQKIAEVIAPDDRAYVLRMLNRETLLEGLRKEKYYTFIYRILQNGKEVYHQIRATFQEMEDGMHIYMGVQNIDTLVQREKGHVEELIAVSQKERNHLQAILATAAAYMEANLTKDLLLEKSDDIVSESRKFIKELPHIDEIQSYSKMHTWICDNLVVDNKEKYKETGKAEKLLAGFAKGEKRASVSFSVSTKEGGRYPCREVFFLYQEQHTGDVHAFCVIYDLTEEQRKEKEVKELERALQMSRIRNFTGQMQPHFLYNALGSIQEVVLEDPEKACGLLEDFTVHLRSCIRSITRDEPIPFQDELANVQAYCNIEKMRLGDKLHVVYDILVDGFAVLPISVQPLVENAIRHGIYKRGPAGGTVTVRTYIDLETYVIEVEDDGLGFDIAEYEEKLRGTGADYVGIQGVRFRLQQIMGASLQIQSRKGKGTIARIRIPIVAKAAGEGETA